MVAPYPAFNPPSSVSIPITINFPGSGLTPPVPAGYPYAAQQPAQPPYGTLPGSGANPFAFPSNYNNMFPAANPQQQLQQAYNNAEQARNSYLNLANQLNNQA